MAPASAVHAGDCVRYIPLSYNCAEAQASALQIILAVRSDWEHGEGRVELVPFTEGITNTLLKAIKARPGMLEAQLDEDAVMLRAYGNGTQILIDREKELANHTLLASHGLAPPLLARFENGLVYRFLPGRVCTPADLGRGPVWRSVARRLGEWHAVVPIARTVAAQDGGGSSSSIHVSALHGIMNGHARLEKAAGMPDGDGARSGAPQHAPAKAGPTLWASLQEWVDILPEMSAEQKQLKALLRCEAQRVAKEMSQVSSIGSHGLVFAHCDLLSGNIVLLSPDIHGRRRESQDQSNGGDDDDDSCVVQFIDYEYATPSPAAFDLANHFAEWAGLDCDYRAIPSRSQRRAFLREYLRSYRQHGGIIRSGGASGGRGGSGSSSSSSSSNGIDGCVLANGADPAIDHGGDHGSLRPDYDDDDDDEAVLNRLFDEVDLFRGVPGFYWGIWGLLQATISKIDFDYDKYAKLRLGEYWAWRRAAAQVPQQQQQQQLNGTSGLDDGHMLREAQWARE